MSYVEPVAPDTETTVSVTDLINPYPSSVPVHVLGRRRLMDSHTLPTPPSSLVQSIKTYNLIDLIKNDSTVASMLKYYKGFRADVRISFVMRAAAGMYGAAHLAYQYGQAAGNNTALFSSQNYLVDISSSEAVEIVIPYRQPWNYYATKATIDDEAITLFVSNLFSASLDGGSSSLDYDLYFALENIEAGLYTSSNIIHPQAEYMVEDPLIDGVGNARNGRLNTLVGAGLSLAGAAAYNYLRGKVVDATTSDQGVPNMDRQTPSTMSGQSKGVRQAFFGDLVSTGDQFGIPSLDTEEYPTTHTEPTGLGMQSDMSIEELGKIPGLIRIFTHTSTTPKDTHLIITPLLGGNVGIGDTPWSFSSYYSRYFRYYRGSHRLVMHFFTSPLIAARYKVSINYYLTPTGAEVTADRTYDVPSEVFLVKGSCVKEFNIPYHSALPVIPTGTTYAAVVVELLTPPSTNSVVDTSIYCVVTHSVDDLEFYSMQHGRPTDSAPPEMVTKQSDVRALHMAESQGTFGKAVQYQQMHMPRIKNLLTLLRRFDTSSDNLGTTLPINSIDTIPWSTTRDDFVWHANLLSATSPFAFISGSVENRLYYTSVSTELKQAHLTNFIDNNGDRVADGLTATLAPQWPVLDYRTPYVSSVPYLYRRPLAFNQLATNTADVTATTSNLTEVFVRAGPDFSVHYPNYLPPSGWAQTPRVA